MGQNLKPLGTVPSSPRAAQPVQTQSASSGEPALALAGAGAGAAGAGAAGAAAFFAAGSGAAFFSRDCSSSNLLSPAAISLIADAPAAAGAALSLDPSLLLAPLQRLDFDFRCLDGSAPSEKLMRLSIAEVRRARGPANAKVPNPPATPKAST